MRAPEWVSGKEGHTEMLSEWAPEKRSSTDKNGERQDENQVRGKG